ncbi:hypothetical protein V2J09_022488, partial [Rumex salicifolius]
ILEFEFTGLPCKKIVLFKCLWFDPSRSETNTHPKYYFFKRSIEKDCIHTYYVDYPDWKYVC